MPEPEGRVVAIWRYPVKSMLGEELNATEVTARGLLGDRAHALIDAETGKVASAKSPRRWPTLFDFRAAYVEPPRDPRALPAVRITLPGGEALTTDQADADARLSAALGRPVRLARSAPEGATAEGYWPDHPWLPQRDEMFDFPLPPGTFFDGAAVHLLTTATLDRLRALAPASRFEVPRFRPNFVIETPSGNGAFVEDGWIGRTLTLGDAQLRIDGPCPRCVMTTLSQGSLPKDPGVLRAAVQGNGGNVGVYATVVRGGRVRRGDAVRPFE
jgi:MOSC domain-containing protein